MNRAKEVLKSIEETIEKTALVHPDHARNVEKRLKEKKVHYHKHKNSIPLGGIPYTGFGIRPEAWDDFQDCCRDCQNSSNNPNPVLCAGTTTATTTTVSNSSNGGNN